MKGLLLHVCEGLLASSRYEILSLSVRCIVASLWKGPLLVQFARQTTLKGIVGACALEGLFGSESGLILASRLW